MPKLPLAVLKDSLNKKIRVRLKDNSTYEGLLIALDEYMNIVLSDVVELGDDYSPKVRWGVALIRGNNILWVEIIE